MKLQTQTRRFLLELADLAGEDQARIITMIMLLSRVPNATDGPAWEMLLDLAAKGPKTRDEVIAGIEEIISYLESPASTAVEENVKYVR